MPEATLSTTRRRKIGRVLRQLREESGYTLKTAGKHLERSPSSLSQIENGVQWLRLRDLGFILDQYDVPMPLRAALMTLAEQDRQPGWWDVYKDLVTDEALDRVSLEHNASRIITTETTFIPASSKPKATPAPSSKASCRICRPSWPTATWGSVWLGRQSWTKPRRQPWRSSSMKLRFAGCAVGVP